MVEPQRVTDPVQDRSADEEGYRSLFRFAPEPMWVCDRETLAFLEANEAALALCGLDRAKLLATRLPDVLPGVEEGQVARISPVPSGGSCACLLQLRSSTGALLEVEASRQDVRFAGRPAEMWIARDITTRSRAERSLRLSEERFRRTFEQAAIGIAHVALDSTFVRTNRRMLEILGRAADDLSGRSMREILPADEAESCLALLDSLVSGLQPAASREQRFLTGNRETVWCNLTLSLARDSEGRPDHFLLVLEDITAHKLAEKALSESEQRFRDVAVAAGEFILEVDVDGRYTYLSERVEEVLGYRPEEILGRTPTSLMPEGEAQRVRSWVLENMTSDYRIRELEHRMLTRDGREIWVRINAGPIFDERGRRTGQRGTGRDITESRRAQEALRASEERLRTLLESAQDGIFIHDADGLCAYANPSGARMVGYRLRELRALRLPALFDAAERARLPDHLAKLQSGVLVRDEWRLQRKDGEVFDAELATQRLPDGRYLAVVRDITERRRAEEEIRRLNATLEQRVAQRTNELELANRELEAFSYSVSHDLRAPLRAINGFAQILLETDAERLSEDGRMMLERVVHNTRRMGRLIDDILDYSRAGRSPLVRETVELEPIAEAIAAELREAYPAARVTLDALPAVRGDPAMLRQILANLLNNAFKFSARSKDPAIEVAGRRDSGRWLITVRDNGAGFDMRYADKLFGMFQRMHGEAQFPGTGVGLAIVKRLVERHGGSVTAQAAPEQGATFGFSLPD